MSKHLKVIVLETRSSTLSKHVIMKQFQVTSPLSSPSLELDLPVRVPKKSSCWSRAMPSMCLHLSCVPWWVASTGLRGMRSTMQSSLCPSFWFMACVTSLCPWMKTSAWQRYITFSCFYVNTCWFLVWYLRLNVFFVLLIVWPIVKCCIPFCLPF